MATESSPRSNLFIGAVMLMLSFTSSAAVIRSPQTASIDLGGPGFGAIANTFNQSGLNANFVSGSTDFDAYLSQSPTHAFAPSGEWFSELGTSSAVVTYDLGSVQRIDRLALWNEDASGIGRLKVLLSEDGATFSPLASDLLPSNNPYESAYVAQVFAFSASDARYVRFEMSECPQQAFGSFPACAIGEVAFSATDAQPVPEPTIVSLLGVAMLGVAALRRRSA